jgi:hypothetical protein
MAVPNRAANAAKASLTPGFLIYVIGSIYAASLDCAQPVGCDSRLHPESDYLSRFPFFCHDFCMTCKQYADSISYSA